MATTFSKRRSRRLAFQPLEERTMMAAGQTNILGGKVGVIVIDGDLYVTGDAAANHVAIAQTQQNGKPVNGSYYIKGLDGTTINGHADYTATGVTRDFRIDMGGGGDNLLLGADPNFSQPSSDKFIVPRDLNVVMGPTNTTPSFLGSATFYANGITVGRDALVRSGFANDDHFYVRGNFWGDVTVISNAKDAYITMWDGFVTHDLYMAASTGSTSGDFTQELSLYDMSIGHDASIVNFAQTGGDNPAHPVYDDINTVTVGNALSVWTNIGNDQIYLENVSQLYLNVQTGGSVGGSNRVDLKGVTVSFLATLNGGSANDRFDVQGNIGSLYVYAGKGNDTLLLHNSNLSFLRVVEDSVYDNGNDVVSLSYVNIGLNLGGSAYVQTGSGADTVSMDHVVVNKGTLTIDTGIDNDQVSLKHCWADELFALLGAGSDTLTISDYSVFRRGTLDGGGYGYDTLVKTRDSIFTEYLHYPHWDLIYLTA